MAYDEELADRLRDSIGMVSGLTEKRMFGGLAFMVNGNMAVAAGSGGGLLLRCDPAQTEALIENPGVTRFIMQNREMNGWLHIDTARLESETEFDRWVVVGLSYAGSLPAK